MPKEKINQTYQYKAIALKVAEALNMQGSSDCCSAKWVVERADNFPFNWEVIRYNDDA